MVAYGEAPTPPGAVRSGEVLDVRAVGQTVKSIHAHGGFQTKDVCIGVGLPSAAVREIELPEGPMPQIRSSLPFQVREALPIPVEEALLDFFPSAAVEVDGRSLLRGLVVAAPKVSVGQLVLAAENGGLKPVAADLSAFALMRAQLSRQAVERTVAFVDVGARVTTVVIAERGAPRLVRVLPSGGADVTDALSQAGALDAGRAEEVKRMLSRGQLGRDSEAVATAASNVTKRVVEAVRNTFVYFASNNPGTAIDAVLMTGGGAAGDMFGQLLASAARVNVTHGSGIGVVSMGKKAPRDVLSTQSRAVAVAVGLGLVVK